MPQVLHIFQKDVRYLRLEISLVLALAAIFAWNDLEWAQLLLPVAATYTIARLIQSEAIPGDRQFWITRPYRWKSLLGAKLLFILVFVSLPISLAQIRMLVEGGFRLGPSLPGLLWSQVLMIAGLWLPVSALAALTGGIVPFIFTTLILLVIVFSGQQMIWMQFRFLPAVRPWPTGVGWVRNSILVIVLAAIAVSVLYLQYKNRLTVVSRLLALMGATAGVAAYMYMPLTAAFAMQLRMSKQPFDGASLRIALEPAPKRVVMAPTRGGPAVRVDLPVSVSGIPDPLYLQTDALSAIFQAPDGRVSRPYDFGLSSRSSAAPATAIFNETGFIDQSFFDERRNDPLTLHASIYFTVFGNPRAKTIPLRSMPADAVDSFRCSTALLNNLVCATPFRWPNLMVDATFEEGNTKSFSHLISYSPFPADIRLDPVETGWTSTPLSAREVTIVVREPLAHFRRDFDVHGLHLADFVPSRDSREYLDQFLRAREPGFFCVNFGDESCIAEHKLDLVADAEAVLLGK